MTGQRAFELRDEHRRILAAMSWEWDSEYGAPTVDGKRPFGSSGRSAILGDVYRIVHGTRPDDELTVEQEAELDELYHSTLTALLVILTSGSTRPGVYLSDNGWTWTPQYPAESDSARADRFAADLRDLNELHHLALRDAAEATEQRDTAYRRIGELDAALARTIAILTAARGGTP